MKEHPQLAATLARAEREGRCAVWTTKAGKEAVWKRVQCGELVSPYPHLFLSSGRWETLDAAAQTLHVIRGLAAYADDIVFCGPTAAVAYGLQAVNETLNLGIYIAKVSPKSIRRVLVRHVRRPTDTPPAPRRAQWMGASAAQLEGVQCSNGVSVLDIAVVLTQCAMLLPFAQALAIFDSAFALPTADAERVRAAARTLEAQEAVSRLLRFREPESANGGESFARGVMIEEGFPAPRVQERFFPATGGVRKTDYSWHLGNGDIIVGELDGKAKYGDPEMTQGRSPEEIAHAQVMREQELLACGVSRIVRFTFDEARERGPLIAKLVAAGVPRFGHAFAGALTSETISLGTLELGTAN